MSKNENSSKSWPFAPAITWIRNVLWHFDVVGAFAVFFGIGFWAMSEGRYPLAVFFFVLSFVYLTYRLLTSTEFKEIKLPKTKIQVRISVMCICGGLLISCLFLVRSHQEERILKTEKASSSSISAQANIPSSGQVMLTRFEVAYNGASIINRHWTVCKIDLLVHHGGASKIESSFSKTQAYDGKLEAGGDFQTDACLSNFPMPNTEVDCVDATLLFSYFFDTHPSDKKDKRYRFIARKNVGIFEWVRSSLDVSGSECESFYHGGLSPEKDFHNALQTIRQRAEQAMAGHSANPWKKQAAQLALDILAFADERDKRAPKQLPEGTPPISPEGEQYRQEAGKWSDETDSQMSSMFSKRLKLVLEEATKANVQGIDPKQVSQMCFHTHGMTRIVRVCGIGIEEVGERFPN